MAASQPATHSTPADAALAPLAWDREDLVRRVRLALGIAKRALAFLGESGYRSGAEADEDSFGPDKPLAETAMLLYVASGVTDPPQIKEWVAELARWMAPLARAQRTACALALYPSICMQLAMPHILLSRLGLPSARFDHLLRLSHESLAHGGREIVPHRALEKMWLESLSGEAPPERAFAAAASSSVLNHPLDLLWGHREDAYAHTHAIMYFTDFGFSLPEPPRPWLEILAESAALLARSLLLEDYDLAAEVLLAWPLTSSPWSAAPSFGFQVLAQLEDSIGFLPAKNGTPAKFPQLSGEERTKYSLAAAYHTAYVMGMLCALSLRPGNTLPARLAGPPLPARVLAALCDMIPDVDTPWRRTLARVPEAERQSLAPFLLDVALLSAARAHDFSAVARLLDLATQNGLAGTPLCAQSAQLLDRIAECANPVSNEQPDVPTQCPPAGR